MQRFVTLTETEFESILNRLSNVESGLASVLKPTLESETTIFTKEETCEKCKLGIDGLNKARREGRIKGVKLNEKEYGYRQSEIDKYLKRYKHYDKHKRVMAI